MSRAIEITIDALDPVGAAEFWQSALEAERRYERSPYVVLGAGSLRLLIQRVDAVDDGKSRVHLDLRVDDPDAEVARLLTLGAHQVEEVDERDAGGSRWLVMTDPWGLVFCVGPSR